MLFTECRTKMTIIDKIIEIIDKPQAARLNGKPKDSKSRLSSQTS